MKFNPHLSNIIGQDIYVTTRGVIYMQFKGNQYQIGNTTSSSIADLKNEAEKYIYGLSPCQVVKNYVQY